LQVSGTDGKDLARDKWKVHKVDSFESIDRDARPEKAFDGNRGSWWHTRWTGGVPRHPHEIQIDLGSEQNITGVRYLPAVIQNDNGMIRDYELYVSRDGKNWGEPVSKGIFVNRIRCDAVHAGDGAFLVGASVRWGQKPRVYRYKLDGKPALLTHTDARVAYVAEPYYVVTNRMPNNEHSLSVLRFDDDKYRFDLGANRLFNSTEINIEGDILVMGRRVVAAADLAKKRFIVAPSDHKLPHNQHGLFLRDGSDSLLKVVSERKGGQTVHRFDLRSGKRTEFTLTDRLDPFHKHNNRDRSFQHFDGVVLLNDQSSITAWVRDKR
jgi:hypothetical protein